PLLGHAHAAALQIFDEPVARRKSHRDTAKRSLISHAQICVVETASDRCVIESLKICQNRAGSSINKILVAPDGLAKARGYFAAPSPQTIVCCRDPTLPCPSASTRTRYCDSTGGIVN